MIKPQELRIGNYVFDIDGDVLQVGEILNIGVKFKNTSLGSRYEKINPIPITEEILLKFGFEIEKTNTHIIAYNDYGYQHELEINKEYKHESWRIEQYKGGYRHLYFCHQLQNLYFSLTGEELTFKKD